jgi:hypothetical protein
LGENSPNLVTLSKMYPNWDFWSEKKASGNPGANNELNKGRKQRIIKKAGTYLKRAPNTLH